jgi:hypothetical protein
MKIRSLYTPHTITITKSERIQRAPSLMTEHNIGVLPVMENGRLVGIVGERDLVHAMAGSMIEPGTESNPGSRGPWSSFGGDDFGDNSSLDKSPVRASADRRVGIGRGRLHHRWLADH